MTDTKPTLEERITQYLTCGGMFNPELAIHDAVSELLFDCRKELAAIKSQPVPVSSDELNKVISDFVENIENDGADGEDNPLTDDQRKFARGVIEGLLGDPEWDELWGRVIAQQAKELPAKSQPVPVEPAYIPQLREYLSKVTSEITHSSCGIGNLRDVLNHIDSLLSQLQVAQQERDANKDSADAFWRIFSLQSGDVKRLIDADMRAEKAEASNKRLVELLREARPRIAHQAMCNYMTTHGACTCKFHELRKNLDELLREAGK